VGGRPRSVKVHCLFDCKMFLQSVVVHIVRIVGTMCTCWLYCGRFALVDLLNIADVGKRLLE